MSRKPILLLWILAATTPALAAEPAGSTDLSATAAVLPSATLAPDSAPPAAAEAPAQTEETLSPRERREALRRAREELRRRFGPSVYVLN